MKEPTRDELLAQIDEMLASLIDAELIEALDEPDPDGRPYRPNPKLQDRFSLDRPLSPFVVDMLSAIADAERDATEANEATEATDTEAGAPAESDPQAAPAARASSPYGIALDMVSVVEASLEDPSAVLQGQRRVLRDEEWARLTAEGVEFSERQNRIAEVDWPRPLRDEVVAAWRIHLDANPWLAGEWVRPKSIARDMFEQGETITGYVHRYGLRRSEGVLVRYLADVYRALERNVPDHLRTPELAEIGDSLAAVVRSVDSSLLAEWERLERIARGEEVDEIGPEDAAIDGVVDITRNRREFRALVRSELFRWVQAAARRQLGAAVAELPQVDAHGEALRRGVDEIDGSLHDFWSEHAWIGIDPAARAATWFIFDEPPVSAGPATGRHAVTQILVDPADSGEWRLHGLVDIDASRDEGVLVIAFAGVERLS
ncbi:MAG: DUF3516 domain-containing protein [Actinobacteria bacterium]|nr:DUF3516 domain-containing protein [Actinomycetota bacterium]